MPPANPITDSILPSATTPTNDLIPSDGFSANESSSASHPQPWSPPQHYSHYSHVPIASLTAGPRPVAFTGRIANVFSFRTASAKPRAARGCWRIVVHDAGGAVTVRLDGAFSGASLTGAFRCGCGSRRCTMAFALGAWCRFGRRMFRVRVEGLRCAARGRSSVCFRSAIVGASLRYMTKARCWDCIACRWDTKKVSNWVD